MHPRFLKKTALQTRLALAASLLISIACIADGDSAKAGPATDAAGDFSYGPPAANEEKIAALLTPTPAILATQPKHYDNDPSGVTLLDEVVHYVDKDGRALRIQQVAYRAFTDAGAKNLGEDVFSYRHKQQTFRLVRAETIQPDGRIDAVTRDAVLVQSPQRQADYALYDDQTEVRIIYPNVRAGSITHATIIIEDKIARMPGAYTYSFIWGAGWPTARERLLVDLPENLGGKLQSVTLGPDIPAPVRENLPDGRVRLTWTKTDEPARHSEVARAPLLQDGPVVHLTTLGSWDEVAAWFTSLVKGRDRLSPSFVAQIEDWTRGLKDRDAIIGTLFTKVANDVRYTGLDLGDADYQPYPCEEVWARRYGDCKDKAFLLVSLLREKGIPAYITLLNTDHAGRIDRRAPDFKVFTHAIVAVPDEHGDGWHFYDPTIAWAEPGMLSPGDAGRDVIIVNGDHARWAHTPPQTAGKLTYDFDLKLAASGELSGWLTMTADGFYGAGQCERFRNLGNDERRQAMSDTVRGFFSGADVIDVTAPLPFVPGHADTIKAYFVVPAQGSAPDGTLALGFPKSSSLFYDLGSSKERESTYFIYRDDTVVNARIALPPGLAPKSLPSPYQIETPITRSESRWTCTADVLSASLRMQFLQSVVQPSEFGQFYQAMLSLRTWLDQPVALVHANTPVITEGKSSDGLDLPLMPSGDGQIGLVDKLYPDGGDADLRREALLRTLQYFPDDKTTVFRATTRLASLDWNADKNQAALDRLDPLLKGYANDVSPEVYSWAETIRALVLRDLKRTTEAEAILLRIAHDQRLSPDRRGQAALDAAHLLESHAPGQAISLLVETADLPSSSQADIYTLLARLELQSNQTSALRDQLASLVHTQPSDAEDVLKTIVHAAADWNDPADGSSQETLLRLVTALVPQPEASLQTALQTVRAKQAARVSFEAIRRKLGECVHTAPLDAWYGKPDTSTLATWDQFKQAIQIAENKKDADQCTRLYVCSLLTLPPGTDFSDRLWKAISYADWRERLTDMARPYPILPLLLDLCDQLPKTEDGYFEGRFLRGAYLARRKDYQAEHALFAALAADPLRPDSYRASAYGRLGASCEHLGDYPGALAAYAELEKSGADSAKNVDCLLRATFIDLHLGRQTEALHLIDLLSKASEDTLLKSIGEYNIRELIALRRSGKAETFWAGQKQWWPLWQALAQKLHLDLDASATVVPVIPDLTALNQSLRQAQQDKDTPAYLTLYGTIISSARWLPSMATEISGLVEFTGQLLPEQATDFRDLAIAAMEAPASSPENLRLRQLQLAARYQDAGRGKDALAIIAAFQGISQPNDEITRGMHRVWALTANAAHVQLKEATAALETDLADANAAASRADTVRLLADLYRAQHRTDDEADLLKRELANLIIAADADSSGVLRQRYEQLGGSTRFAREAADWLRANPIPWYGFAAPADLLDPRLRNLDETLANPDNQFNPAEIVKLNLLVAQNADGSLDRQQNAFVNAFAGLLRLTASQAEADRLAASVIDDPSLDEPVRISALWSAIIDSYTYDRPEAYRHWRDHPLASKLSEQSRGLLPSFTLYMDADRASSAAFSSLADQTIAHPEMASIDVGLVQDVVAQLLRLGDTASVRRICDGVPRWNLGPNVTTSREAIQLGFLRLLTGAEPIDRVHDALIQKTLDRFPTPPTRLPSVCADRRDIESLPVFSPETTRDAALYLIGRHRFDRGNLRLWHTFIRALSASPDTAPLGLELIGTALAAAPDDETRAAVISALSQAVDLDNPAVRQRMDTLLARYDSPADAPLTHEQIAMLRLTETLRLGQPVDPSAFLGRLHDPVLDYIRTCLSLRHYTQTGDAPALKRVIDGMPPDRLLNPGLLQQTIPALDLLGMKPEADLARETARRELHNALLMAWAGGDPNETQEALDLAELLADPDSLPPGWVDAVATQSPIPMLQVRARLLFAWLRHDWITAAREASQALQRYPTYYRFDWYQGAALFRAGRMDSARRALTTYVNYAKDEADYPEALALLKQIDGAPLSRPPSAR